MVSASHKGRGLMMGFLVVAGVVWAISAHADEKEDELQAAFSEAVKLREKEEYQKALTLFERALVLAPEVFGSDHENFIIVLENLAFVYQAVGEYAKAEPLYQRCLEIREAKLGRDHIDITKSLDGLAIVYLRMGQLAKAEPLFKRSLEICEAKLGRDHPDVAATLNNLATLYKDIGRLAKAEALYRRSLEISEVKLGSDHPTVAATLGNLAVLYQIMGQLAKAEPLYQRSLKISEARLGRDHPQVADALNNLGNLYKDMGQLTKAEPFYKRSLKIYEGKLGMHHPLVTTPLDNLAILYKVTGQRAKAGALYQRSLEICEAKLGRNHPDVARTLNNLAGLRAAEARWAEASKLFDRQRREVRRYVADILPGLSEKDQLTFLNHVDEKYLHGAMSVGLASGGEGDLGKQSASWLVNGKAVAQQALAYRAQLAWAGSHPATSKLARELTEVRRQLAALTLASYKDEQAQQRQKKLTKLVEREQELSTDLGQAVGRPAWEEPWVELEQVRTALPADRVLVEIGRFTLENFKAKAGEKESLGFHYAAWVIPPAGNGDVQIVDLGEAGKIEQAVAAVRQSLRAAQGDAEHKSRILEAGEPVVEKELAGPLKDLSRLVLEPLLPHIQEFPKWYVSPDGALWLVPWAALPLADGRYAIEKHQISYLVSGRDLVIPPAKAETTRPKVMADPDYDLGLEMARAEAKELLENRTAPAELRGLPGNRLSIGRAPRLPGTAVEAQAIKPALERYSGEEVWVYRGAQALECVFKELRNPRILVLATHGFFLEDQEVKSSDTRLIEESRGPVLTKEGNPLENPLLRCGLLLAGCNNREQAREGDEDGVLTGLEIVGTDLRGTELVVLSACETGLGQVRNGEGVAGLRQAFQLAGAQSVVATLWQIPDRESAKLISAFFENLAAGKGKAEALREAQLAIIKQRRDRNGAAHPFFWAAFTLTGKGE